MDKVSLNLDGNIATIEEGKDTFLGQLLAQAGKVRINTQNIQREVTILSGTQPKSQTKPQTSIEVEEPIKEKPQKSKWSKRGK